jgi:hypothetical protein
VPLVGGGMFFYKYSTPPECLNVVSKIIAKQGKGPKFKHSPNNFYESPLCQQGAFLFLPRIPAVTKRLSLYLSALSFLIFLSKYCFSDI